ncbi:MAG: hypothetical protein VB034_02370 [Eubacteriales bacterium]|nr:hypothetical protein [Eubacteriales bacterium]
MDINKTPYYCDPQKNTPCRKRRCALFGGLCCITFDPEYALCDPNGNPQIATPKQQIELRACYALIKLEKRSQASRAGVGVRLNGDEIQSLIENSQLTINGARSMMGLPPIDTPCANKLLINKPD